VRAALADGDAEEEMATEKRYEYLMSTTNNNSYTRARILLHRRTVTRLAHGSSGERTQSYKWDTTLTHKRARATLACWFAMRPILPPTLLFLALFVVTHARATYATVTPLRFLSAAGPGRSGRRINPHRRRMTPDGIQMKGNMHTLGYFSADACVGTPPRRFDLIVDTGSSLTAFPCSDCTHCGAHQHPGAHGMRFSEDESSTSEACAAAGAITVSATPRAPPSAGASCTTN
jgi:hypothetical protein